MPLFIPVINRRRYYFSFFFYENFYFSLECLTRTLEISSLILFACKNLDKQNWNTWTEVT